MKLSTTLPLKNAVILVTGAAGKLGSIAAKACATAGATVILLDKAVSALEKEFDSIVAANAPEPAIYPLDMAGASEQHYFELADIIRQKYGFLSGLLHNAAELGTLGPIEDLEYQSWTTIFNVNLNAPFLLTKALLPLLKSADDASIVFTSDSSAQPARAYWGAYSISKIASEHFAKILADETENTTNVRVNMFVPGPVRSPMRRWAYPAEDLNLLADPESFADFYIYLLGPASRGMSGQTIYANQFNQSKKPCSNTKA